MGLSKFKLRRRSQFIDWNLQGRLVVRCAMHWVLFTLAATLLGFLIQICVDPMAGWQRNLHAFWSVFGPTALVLVCLMPVFVFDFVQFSHRFVGPVIKARSVLNELAQGRCPDQISLRDDDFYAEIAADLNALIEEVRNARQGKLRSESLDAPVIEHTGNAATAISLQNDKCSP